MHTFLERVASICNATKQFMIDKCFTAVINKYVSLIVLFTIGIYLDITRIALYSAFIFIALMIKQFIDAKTVAYRVEYFDKESPTLLKSLIADAINQYYIYHFSNMTGAIPYINSKQEIEINHGVMDILLTRLEGSAMLDKFNLYYGKNFMEVLVVQVNLIVTEFVVNLNGMEPARKKKARVGNMMNEDKNLGSFLADMGFEKLR